MTPDPATVAKEIVKMPKVKRDEPMMTARRLVHGIVSMVERNSSDDPEYQANMNTMYQYAIDALTTFAAQQVAQMTNERDEYKKLCGMIANNPEGLAKFEDLQQQVREAERRVWEEAATKLSHKYGIHGSTENVVEGCPCLVCEFRRRAQEGKG